ncbi:MAG: phosphate ABC transporter permease PstA [Puniceicoccaceae bacterium]
MKEQVGLSPDEAKARRELERSEYPRGEPQVWFTSMGLSIGIIMVVTLLAVILLNGFSVFWPKKIYEFTLVDGITFQGSSSFAGAITLEREKRMQVEGETDRIREFQMFVGNKREYGQMFKFIDAESIADRSVPEDIVELERLEWGNAVGFPVELRHKSGEVIRAEEETFKKALAVAISEANERRERFTRIESKPIGRINREKEKLRLERNFYASQVDRDNTARIERIDQAMDELQERYEVLAAEARVLRAAADDHIFVYRLATGQIVELPVGEITYHYYPNQMGLMSRIGFFVGHIWTFLTEEPREANTEGGIFPAIFGTFTMTLLMSIAVMPFGVIAAVYLREYAKQGPLVRSVRIAINNLAGVPSIVYGVFGLGFFVYVLGGNIDDLLFAKRLPTPTFGTGGILWASLTLALMTVPVVVVATEEALSAVPRGVREASLACGASKWQTIQRLVLPASAPGMLTGLILAMARGAGEVAPLMLVGVVKLAPALPIDGIFPFIHLERKFMHLGFHIYDLGFQSPDSDAAKPMVFATTLLLIVLVVLLNITAISIRNHLRKKYKGDTF